VDDLRNNVLRMVGSRAFVSDPLRMIKGIHHATVLGVEPKQESLYSMQREVTSLCWVADERIWLEAWRIFASKQAPGGLRLLASTSAGNYLFNKD
jgi:tRNA nucleotidyltransferase/poly(A) polymerase